MKTNTTTIETKTFGAVTATWRGFEGARSLQLEAANQPLSHGHLRPAKSGGEYIVELSMRWVRADKTLSPGFKISGEQYAALIAVRDASNYDIAPLGKTQIWDQSDK